MSMEVIAGKMIFGGDCIAENSEKKIFIPYTIPGEKVQIEIEKDFKDYSTAKNLGIIEKSRYRTEPFCPYYGKCGGCSLQHIDPEYQKILRAQILRDAFLREGITVPEIQVISSPDRGYRARFQLHDGGLMEKRSSEIIPISHCPCATEEVNRYLKEIPPNERPRGRVHIFGSKYITSVPDGFDKIVISKPETPPVRTKGKKQKAAKPRHEGTSPDSESLCTVSLLGKSITFDAQGFFQSNLEALEKTIPLITEGLSGKNVLDTYSGAGTFSVFLADRFENTILVEHNKGAVVYAEQNLAGKKHKSFGVSGDVWVKYHAETCRKELGAFDAVVIDPPRSGMEKSVRSWLKSSDIPVIRSLSCDPATHARDIQELASAGYKLKKLFLLDFYPQTSHIESLGYLEK
ncbi:class I SAM-dependent RNA methyltransferase [Treponema sp.]|uniref:class I SAM-dependent RNA methyltransferase n=1 Tax=Treponema sp. TaxID=166 RepID=UPI003F0A2228